MPPHVGEHRIAYLPVGRCVKEPSLAAEHQQNSGNQDAD
jgi:hypothetical protein